MSFIEMDHIRKQFGNLEVLKDVTLHVDEGEVVSIIGPTWKPVTLSAFNTSELKWTDDIFTPPLIPNLS